MRKLYSRRVNRTDPLAHARAVQNYLAMIYGYGLSPAYYSAEMRQEARRAIRELQALVAALG
jgi:hypothetical protein